MAVNFEIDYLPYQIDIFFNTTDYKYLVIRKGRRVGLTKGGANAFIEYMLDGNSPLLWVDTINGNIDRYFDRYFYPELKKLPTNKWNFNRQKRELRLYNSICDFRSADSPESIEGFGYKKIFLNEAGIILKDGYLYTNAILPMLLDFPDSQLIAAGVPKGKFLKNGNKHKFFELYEKALAGERGYKTLHYTTYDNKKLSKEEIDALSNSMSETEYRQEILGEFVEYLGENPFAHQYRSEKHESEKAVFDPSRELYIIVDFNLNPFCVTFKHNWRDNNGFHSHTFDEAEIKHGSIPDMIDLIRSRYENKLPTCRLTGDHQGVKGDISQRDNASYYEQLKRGLGIRDSQIVTPANPTHENSRADLNYLLYHHPDWKINPKTCPNSVRDMKSVQCDAFGQIVKRDRKDLTQRADYLDCQRYDCNTNWWDWIQKHKKGHYRNNNK